MFYIKSVRFVSALCLVYALLFGNQELMAGTKLAEKFESIVPVHEYIESGKILLNGSTLQLERGDLISGEDPPEPLIIFTFDDGEITPQVADGRLIVSELRISSGSVGIGSASSANFPDPPYAQSSVWNAETRESAKFFYFDISLWEGFTLQVNRISFETNVTDNGPSATGVTLAGEVLPEVNLTTELLHYEVSDLNLDDLTDFTVKLQAWLNGSRSTSGGGAFRVDNIRVYGEILTDSEVDAPPIVSSTSLGNLRSGGFEVTPNIIYSSGLSVIEKGVLVAPTSVDSELIHGEPGVLTFVSGSLEGNEPVAVSGLSPATKYRYRTFATSDAGTGYSIEDTLITLIAFDGFGYLSEFELNDSGGIVPNGWILSDTTVVGIFETTTTGGLRYSDGIIGYQITGLKPSFTASIKLENTTGEQITELAVSYDGHVSGLTGGRFPSWNVSLNDQPVPELVFSTAEGVTRKGIQYIITGLGIDHGDTIELEFSTTNVDGSGSHRRLGFNRVMIAIPTQLDISITGSAGWRMFSPVTWYQGMSSIAEISPIQGFNGDGFERNLYFGYDGDMWLPDSGATDTVLPESLAPGSGYILYLYDNDEAGSEPIGEERHITMQGIDPFFDVSIPVHSDGNRWNLLGNPFATGFDIRTIQGDGNFVPVVQLWKNLDSPGDEDEPSGTWVLSNSTSVNHIIAAGQGFMLQNDEESPSTTITFPVAGKTDGGVLMRDAIMPQPVMEFQLLDGSGRTLDLSTQLVFPSANSDMSMKANVNKLPSLHGGAQLLLHPSDSSTSSGYAQYAVYADLTSESNIWLSLTEPECCAEYILSWYYKRDIPHNWQFRLLDLISEDVTEMDFITSYRFQSADSDSILGPRFRIELINHNYASVSTDEIPERTQLYANYPNPFNPTTTLPFDLANETTVDIEIYNVLGQVIYQRNVGQLPAGRHQITVDGSNWSSGIYLVRMRTSDKISIRNITLIK